MDKMLASRRCPGGHDFRRGLDEVVQGEETWVRPETLQREAVAQAISSVRPHPPIQTFEMSRLSILDFAPSHPRLPATLLSSDDSPLQPPYLQGDCPFREQLANPLGCLRVPAITRVFPAIAIDPLLRENHGD
ncbi:hypothetical protein BDK51DRAFT_40493 [Blyttiomyces helicus]|uniref:Uncharacterized protein n=1 Tax=Blyttiomyces helicus TaxID=388810 RepID=A0A4P9VY60_9FUNG|nr:hypothetical protein BDK51DRAFT_40493 [Blyttiomyces helicus]|eukprot:RKO84711.1 hypothetical protein BDK51DRAFT_40493 [Blyttiomyces helicus]